MTFRTRLFLGILGAVLQPLGALAYGVRREMEQAFRAELGLEAEPLDTTS